MTPHEAKSLKHYGHFSFKEIVKRQYRVDNNSAYLALMDYLGLSEKERNNCSLKGLLIMKEEAGQGKIGTELDGIWWLSQTPTKGVVTDLVEGYKCEFAIVNQKGTIDRIYRYRLKPINPEETYIDLEMIQYYALTPFQLLNPHIIQSAIYRILKGILPFRLYDEVEKILPSTLLNSIAKEAFPSYIEKKETEIK